MGDNKNGDVETGTAVKEQATFHVMSVEQTAEFEQTDLVNGLTAAEAAVRLEKYGPNKLTEGKKRTLCEKIYDQVANVLVIILAIVAIISAIKAASSVAKGDSEDAITGWIEVVLIIGVIVLNTYIGILQEGKAEKSAEALKAMLSSEATVIRDGKKQTIAPEDIVLGDVVCLSTGDRIPADLRMIHSANLASQEAALTGESVPVDKITVAIEAENPTTVPLGDRKNLCFSATLIASGEGKGIVVACGDDTEIGQINTLVSTVEKKKTNVLVQIDIVSKWIAIFVVCTAIVTFCVAYFVTYGGNSDNALDAVSIALVTSVAMIPEGLAAIVTLTYAWAVSNMATHNAIVRILPAVETLGSVTVICSDKTGTLTMNLMSVVAFVTSNCRYAVDANATEKLPTNFKRDDTVFSENKQKKAASEPSATSVKSSAIAPQDAKVTTEEGGEGEVDKTAVEAEAPAAVPVPASSGEESSVAVGASPDADYIRSALATGILCSHAEPGKDGGRDGEIGNPTELSILYAARNAGIDLDEVRASQEIVAEVPFSSEYKFMATVHNVKEDVDKAPEGMVVHVKGAIDRLIPLTTTQAKGGVVGPDNTEPVNKEYWLDAAEALSSHGLRVIALCRAYIPAGSVEKDQKLEADFVNGKEPWLTIVGLTAILDPPRPECVDAIKEAHGAGVRVAMITGDHKATAIAIGEMLGIVDEKYNSAVTGPELDDMDDVQLQEAVLKFNVFARASPANKIRIVKALQARGQVCSMTGDGVNDAPALKAADMGVAMGKEGTDVAREASEMILADDNFATIVRAVREGRVVWDNLRKVLLFNTPVNNAQGMTVLFGLAGGLPYFPLSAIQVLYCNLICAVTLGFVLAVEPAEEGIMKNPPRRVGKRLIGRFLLWRIAYGTIVLVCFTVGAVFWVYGFKCSDPGETLCGDPGRDRVYSPNQVRSQASNTLTLSAICIMLTARFAYNTSFHPRIFRGNPYAWYSTSIVIVLQICITYIPGLNNVVFQMEGMDKRQWGICILFVVATFVAMEIEKGIKNNVISKNASFDVEDEKPAHEYFVAADEDDTYQVSDSQRSATLSATLLKK